MEVYMNLLAHSKHFNYVLLFFPFSLYEIQMSVVINLFPHPMNSNNSNNRRRSQTNEATHLISVIMGGKYCQCPAIIRI